MDHQMFGHQNSQENRCCRRFLQACCQPVLVMEIEILEVMDDPVEETGLIDDPILGVLPCHLRLLMVLDAVFVFVVHG